MASFLSPRQIADAIGVSESSVRRWADSGRIKMARTAGGHRKIARADAIRFIRDNAAEVVRPDLLHVGGPPRHRRHGNARGRHGPWVEALEAGDTEQFFGLITGMYLDGVRAAEICDGPLRESLNRIGQKWPSDRRAIFLEHRATNICIDALNRLRSLLAGPSREPVRAIGGALEEDPYILPSMMAMTVLEDLGFEATNLGPNTPFEILAQSADETGAALIWIAMTSPLPRNTVHCGLAELARQLDGKAQIVLGGRSCGRYRIPAAAHVHRFSSLAEMAGFAEGVRAALINTRFRPTSAADRPR